MNALEQKDTLPLLVRYLREMIADGCQLVHGGQVIGWEATEIPDLLSTLEQNMEAMDKARLEPGQLLENNFSGQRFAVTEDDGETVHLVSVNRDITYPKSRLGLLSSKVE